MREQIDEVLQFWFGDLKEGFPVADKSTLWWGGSQEIDQQITELFANHVRQALQGTLDSWKETPRGRLALILLLDQFTRNIYRGSGAAFSGDVQALAITQESIQLGYDQALEFTERLFLYMPLEHAESLPAQDLSVSCMAELTAQIPVGRRGMFENVLDFAVQHRDVIKRFGRFPHRNQALERESTEEELAYLNQSHARWGQ
ncbi:DUF924 family protein [Neptunomonas sp.]|uniref:DUF924 family protein n=1 Tax=Neptunomonas TaxID=75687 RepID=UPI00351313A7